eukprot:7364700-Karenia_brevis.AAC.1
MCPHKGGYFGSSHFGSRRRAQGLWRSAARASSIELGQSAAIFYGHTYGGHGSHSQWDDWAQWKCSACNADNWLHFGKQKKNCWQC